MDHTSSRSYDVANEPLPLRDNAWLEDRLRMVWGRYFTDIPRGNEVVVHFGRRAHARLGSIVRERTGAKRSVITITGFFRDRTVPDFVVDTVIGHELAHYAHGFSSPHRQLYRHPHEGGVVSKELKARGMGEALKLQRKWLRLHWKTFVVTTRKGIHA